MGSEAGRDWISRIAALVALAGLLIPRAAHAFSNPCTQCPSWTEITQGSTAYVQNNSSYYWLVDSDDDVIVPVCIAPGQTTELFKLSWEKGLWGFNLIFTPGPACDYGLDNSYATAWYYTTGSGSSWTGWIELYGTGRTIQCSSGDLATSCTFTSTGSTPTPVQIELNTNGPLVNGCGSNECQNYIINPVTSAPAVRR